MFCKHSPMSAEEPSIQLDRRIFDWPVFGIVNAVRLSRMAELEPSARTLERKEVASEC